MSAALSRYTHASVTSVRTGAKKKNVLEARREMNEHTLTSCEKRRTTDINQTGLSV